MSIVNTLAKISRERTGAARSLREAAIRDHEHIVDALRARDPGAAASAMRAHLDHVEAALAAMTAPDAGEETGRVAAPGKGAAPKRAAGRRTRRPAPTPGGSTSWIAGTFAFDAPPDAVYRAICDPEALMAVIPGCEDIEQVAPNEYRGRIALRLPGLAGSYATSVRLVDAEPPRHAAMEAHLDGPMGSVEGRATFDLAQTRARHAARLRRRGGHRRPARPARLPLRGRLCRIGSSSRASEP